VSRQRVESRRAEQLRRGKPRRPRPIGPRDALADRAVERDEAEADLNQFARMRPALRPRAQRQWAKLAVVGREFSVAQALGEESFARHRLSELERASGGENRRPDVA